MTVEKDHIGMVVDDSDSETANGEELRTKTLGPMRGCNIIWACVRARITVSPKKTKFPVYYVTFFFFFFLAARQLPFVMFRSKYSSPLTVITPVLRTEE